MEEGEEVEEEEEEEEDHNDEHREATGDKGQVQAAGPTISRMIQAHRYN